MFSGKKSFAYWQWRTILGTMFGYALFYFIRKNISVAMPFMEADLGVSKAQLGIFLTLHGVVYGFSKLGNGILGDRSNARVFMVSGLLLAAACNIVFGLSSSLLVFGLVWILNGWFQGMGFPPCARLITHWVPPNELATKMAVWNASHSIGAALVVVLCGYVAAHLGMDNTGVASWRWCFLIPSAIAIAGALALWLVIRDTPSSVGLPELPGTHASNRECGDLSEKRPSVSQIPNLKSQIPPPSAPTPSPDDFKAFLRKNVFLNPVVWLAGVAMFFVYVLRYALLDWAPTFLNREYGIAIIGSVWMTAAFEIAGIAGMLFTGWATDRFFGGRAARVCLLCMVFATAFITLFWLLPLPPSAMTLLLMGAGFCIYGPQALCAPLMANLVTRRGAASAVGVTSLFAYGSTVFSGWGLGLLADTCGWSAVFACLCAAGLVGVAAWLPLWRAKAHNYAT